MRPYNYIIGIRFVTKSNYKEWIKLPVEMAHERREFFVNHQITGT